MQAYKRPNFKVAAKIFSDSYDQKTQAERLAALELALGASYDLGRECAGEIAEDYIAMDMEQPNAAAMVHALIMLGVGEHTGEAAGIRDALLSEEIAVPPPPAYIQSRLSLSTPMGKLVAA